MPKDKVLNVEQVRQRLGCSRAHVYNLINMGSLSAFRIGSKNGLRVKESVVDNFIESRAASEEVAG